jgi:hypothetical protein
LEILPRPRDAHVAHAIARLTASRRGLETLVGRDRTVLVDITLRRIVHTGTFQLSRDLRPGSLTDQEIGRPIS